MKIFLDTASINEIKAANNILELDGVTTNPTLIMREGRDYNKALKEICSIVKGPVSAETISANAEGMVIEGKQFSRIANNIVVKVPMTQEGMKACAKLTKSGIKVNTTLVFSANQALLAAKAGTYIVSPFIGRLDDIGNKGISLIKEIRQIYDNYKFKTQILVASIRNPIHVKEAALIGVDIATMPFDIYEKLFKHSLTDIGIKKFEDDWGKLQKGLKRA